MTSIPASALDVIGRHGPVRRLAACLYVGTCPVCLVDGALSVTITPTGELPRCKSCLAALVAKAIKDDRPPPDPTAPRARADTP